MNVREALDNIYKEFEKTYEEAKKEGREQGLEEAWECTKKLSSEISGENIKSLFDVPYCEVFKKFTASEAIAKVKEYEEKQKQTDDEAMTVEEYRKRMIKAFQNADCEQFIALVCLPTEKEFEHLEWLLREKFGKEEKQTKKSCDNCGKNYCGNALCFGNNYCEWVPKQTDDEIKVGDEVIHDGEQIGVVTQVDEYGYQIMDSRGECGCWITDDIKKTGRHFPQIAEVLMQMKEGE